MGSVAPIIYNLAFSIAFSMNKTDIHNLPHRASLILYTFRRCPYAMRARMALAASELPFETREVVLKDKPPEMLDVSPKGTVPVLVIGGENIGDRVIDESLDIVVWALEQNDPQGWLDFTSNDRTEMAELVEICEQQFKANLDRYKYADRHPENSPSFYQSLCLPFLDTLEAQLMANPYLFADRLCYADIAIFPFIRQFANVDAKSFESLDYPQVKDWLSQLVNGDLFKVIMTKYPQWHAGDESTFFNPNIAAINLVK